MEKDKARWSFTHCGIAVESESSVSVLTAIVKMNKRGIFTDVIVLRANAGLIQRG